LVYPVYFFQRMEPRAIKRIRPSPKKKHALMELFSGSRSSTYLLNDIISLCVGKSLQEVLEFEQNQYLSRSPYQRDEQHSGFYRNGYEKAHLKTTHGVVAIEKPQVRGGDTPYLSELWLRLNKTTESLRQ